MHDIKKVGDFEATVHFHKEVEVKVPVKVVAEEEQKPAEAPVEDAPKAEAPAQEEAPAESPVQEEEEAPAAE